MAHYRSTIIKGGRKTTRIPVASWTDRIDRESIDNSDGASAESSRCASGNGTPPASSIAKIGSAQDCMDTRHDHGLGVEVIELVRDHSEAALQDLLGLRLAGSRTAGVFVHSIQAGSVAESNGRVQPGDQLIQVDSIRLIGLTPDQAARVLRSEFAMTTSEHVHLTVAHPWADKSERYTPHALSLSFSAPCIISSKSESDLNTIVVSDGCDGNRAKTPTGLIAGTFHPKVSPAKQHTLGAIKLKRVGPDHSTTVGDRSITVTTALINSVPPSASMIDIVSDSQKKTSLKNGFTKSHHDQPLQSKKKISTNKVGHYSELSSANHSRKNSKNGHGAVLEDGPTNHCDRKKLEKSIEPFTATDSAPLKPTDDVTGCASNNNHIGSKFEHVRNWDSDKNWRDSILNKDKQEAVHVAKRVSKNSDLAMIPIPRRATQGADTGTSDNVPLVSFDQLNRPASPIVDKRVVQSSSSGQSKSSKGSNQSRASQGSQQLSWQCPVCLDGASRIRRTKRKMMSTACGHVFCNSCVEDVVGKYHVCPTCRTSIKSMNDVHPIFM